MGEHNFMKRSRGVYRMLIIVCALFLVIAVLALYFGSETPGLSDGTISTPDQDSISTGNEGDPNKIVDGIHVRTGLIAAEGHMAVVNNCTNCHSAQLVIQNRMDREHWISTIRWMQKTQNLWDLGTNEEVIVNYLVTNYPPGKKGRRPALTEIEWYDLKQ